jgi:four helix bundle protein
MSEAIRSYQDLIVWQKAMVLIDEVDVVVESLSRYHRSWLGLQLHRAALSVASNIAEGHASDYRPVYLRQLSSARGSLAEAETQLLVIQRRRYPRALNPEAALVLTPEIGRMLRTLSSRLRRC